MGPTFGEYLMARRIDRATANPALIRRIQAAPGVAEVTTFDELVEILGALGPRGDITLKIFWQTYRGEQRTRDRQSRHR